MLTKEEKEEMIADAMNTSRRDDFRAVKTKTSSISVSLDDYIHFLDDIQAIYGSFKSSKDPIPSHNNKL